MKRSQRSRNHLLPLNAFTCCLGGGEGGWNNSLKNKKYVSINIECNILVAR